MGKKFYTYKLYSISFKDYVEDKYIDSIKINTLHFDNSNSTDPFKKFVIDQIRNVYV